MLKLVQDGGAARTARTSQISGGQQQRVALARALAPQPKVLLLDEPLSALDYKLRKEMQIELKRLQHETGITFIFVTHDQEEALTMSDRIAVMSTGKILQVGTPREIYDQPADRFVADFIGETNFLEAEVVAADPAIGRQCGCASGAIVRGRVPGGLGPGGKVTVAVRPEHADLMRRGADGTLAGTVGEHRLFRHRHALPRRRSTAATTSSCACRTAASGAVTFEPGAKVGIRVRRPTARGC